MTQSVPSVFTFTSQTVRVLVIDGAPWFVAADVAEALDYRNAPDMTRILDDDEKGTQIVRTPGGDQELTIINEPGLYAAILKSRKPAAKRFKKWVTAEVLPAIRKTGRYEMAPPVRAAEGLTREQIAELSRLIHRASSGWVFGDGTAQAIHNRLRVIFGVRDVTCISPAQFVDAIDLLRDQERASDEFLRLIMELRNWFDREVAGAGTPWTPAIKARLTREMKGRIELPAKVDWLALAAQTTKEGE